jgi:hypothetical protein
LSEEEARRLLEAAKKAEGPAESAAETNVLRVAADQANRESLEEGRALAERELAEGGAAGNPEAVKTYRALTSCANGDEPEAHRDAPSVRSVEHEAAEERSAKLKRPRRGARWPWNRKPPRQP